MARKYKLTGFDLKAARARIDVSQVELAITVGVHPNTIRRLEKHKVSPFTCSHELHQKIMEALAVFGVRFNRRGDLQLIRKAPAEEREAA